MDGSGSGMGRGVVSGTASVPALIPEEEGSWSGMLSRVFGLAQEGLRRVFQREEDVYRAAWRVLNVVHTLERNRARREVLLGLVWACVAQRFENVECEGEVRGYWMRVRSTSRAQRLLLALQGLGMRDLQVLESFVSRQNSRDLEMYYRGALALVRAASAVHALGWKFCVASEEEDVLHAIDGWVVRSERVPVPVQVKSRGMCDHSVACVLEPGFGRAPRDSVKRAWEHLSTCGIPQRIVWVKVGLLEGGSLSTIHESPSLQRCLRGLLL